MTLDALGWDAAAAAALAVPVGAVPGRVVRVDVDSCLVATDDGECRVEAMPLPAVGDWVAVDPATGRVTAVAPRRSQLVRADARRRQVLAANVDVVLVVLALDTPDRVETLDRLDREAALALASGAAPGVILTKSDAVADADAFAREVRRRLPGIDVVVTSAVTGQGVDAVADALQPHRTAVLLGRSGAGKSSLVNRLLGEDVMAIGDLRADGEGRHTTTARRLLVVPAGGVLIDIPGLRSLGLAAAEAGVARLFADVEELAEACHFADCRHEGEPGCALTQAIDGGELDPARVERWRRLRHEAAHPHRSGSRNRR